MSAPSDVIDLKDWKLTLPMPDPDDSSKVWEVKQPELTGFVHAPWFANWSRGGVLFGAPVNGKTTSGSLNPRCELREMNGPKLASWSSSVGAHTMTAVLAFTKLPIGKPHLVGGQIHDAKDDVIVWRLEGKKLWLTNGDETNWHLVTDSYELGTAVEVKFVVWADQVRCYFNGTWIVTLVRKFSGAYFKMGSYVQAHCGQDGVPCSSDNVGQVTVFSLVVSHTTVAPGEPQPIPKPEEPPMTAGDVVLIYRHGEKPDKETSANKGTLSARGKERAEKIAWLFTRPTIPFGLPKPTILFASSNGTVQRMERTQGPLAEKLKLKLNKQFDAEVKFKDVGKWLAAQHGVTAACLEHSSILQVCQNLGKVSEGKLPKSWPDTRFDMIFRFDRKADGTWKFTQVPEMLLVPGDSTKLFA